MPQLEIPVNEIDEVIDKIMQKSNWGGLEVGTRNLLLQTNQGTTGWEWNHPVGNGSGTVTAVEALGANAVNFLVNTPSTSWQYVFFKNINYKLLESKKQYTLEFDIKSNHNSNLGVWFRDRENVSSQIAGFGQCVLAENTWKHFSATVTIAEGISITNQGLYITGINVAGRSVTIANVILAEGTKCGSWLPAPEDNIQASGDVVSGLLKLQQGSYAWYTNGSGNYINGYFHLATLKIKKVYIDNPYSIEFNQRGRIRSTVIHLLFENVDSLDPGVSSIRYTGADANVYIAKSGTGTFELYVKKGDIFDRLVVLSFLGEFGEDKLSVTWQSDIATALPSDAIQATKLI